MTVQATPPPTATDPVAVPLAGDVPAASRRARHRATPDPVERSILSSLDRRSPLVRAGVVIVGGLLLILLTVVCLAPLLWLFKAATSTTTETLAEPFGWWPSGIRWENFTAVFTTVDFGRYFLNTLWVMLGSLVCGLVVATTGGYGLAVLKPKYAPVVSALVLATLFIPGVISLVSLYLTVVKLPIVGVSLINTFWAVWLPSAASAVSVLLMQRFFAAIPAEIFEAARIDGAGPFRVFWSIALPLSRPILGVISLLTAVGAYKEFLWPLLVLPKSENQPISVILPRLEQNTDYAQFLAALFVSVIVPVVLFLVFQRQFLRAAGNAGALKG